MHEKKNSSSTRRRQQRNKTKCKKLRRFCCLIFFFNETPTTEIYTRPYTLSLHDALPISPPASSNTMINRPSCWNTGLAMSGAMLVCSQLSAVLKEQSCASLHRLGTMFENAGSVPFAKSVANRVKGTLLHPCPVGSFATSESSGKMLCLRA